MAPLGADVTPAASLGLGLAAELHRPGEHVDELLPALGVLLLAEDLRQKEHREAVAVGIAVVLERVADQPVGPAAGDEVVDGRADIGGVLALGRGRALAEKGDSGHSGHGGWVLAVARGPRAAPGLVRRKPLEPLGHGGADAGIVASIGRAAGKGTWEEEGHCQEEEIVN